MERLRIVRPDQIESGWSIVQGKTPDASERLKAVVKDLTEKALEIVNRISAGEMSKSEPKAELVDDYYLIYHYLDYLKRFVSSKA